MTIIPDDKDWTWVLERSCPECGFDAVSVTPATAATAIVALLPRWQMALRRAGAPERPAPGTWSVLEYGAHVRDVFEVFTGRLHLMLSRDNPTFDNWDQDRAAVDGNYYALDPAQLVAELTHNGQAAADAFASVTSDQWDRRGLRSNGSEFTVLTLSGYFLHDLIHHLHDVNA